MTVETPKNAKTIRCESCGSSIELGALASVVTCGHCGHGQQVDAELLAELREYSDEVHEQLEQADLEQQQAVAWERSTAALKGRNKAIGYVVPIVLCLIVPGGVAAVFSVLVSQGVVAQEKMQYLAYILPAFSVLGIGGYYAWYYTRYRRKRAAASELAAAEVGCPSCGASNRIDAGEVLESCGHCGAALMPDHTVRQRSVDAAVEAHRRAQMKKYRAERQGYASLQRVGLGPVGTILMVGGPFLLMVGGGSIAFSYSMWVGDDPYSPAIFAMWGLTIALVIGLAVAVSTIRRRQARVRDGVAALAASLGGRALDGLAGTVGWLNSFWAGPIDPFEMMPGSCYGAGAIVLGGYHVLVDVNPKAASQQHRKWARILVACAVPGVLPNDDSTAPFNVKASRLIQRLSAVGFEVKTSEAGLFGRARDEIVPNLRKSGEISTLAVPITEMARLADALGAAPVGEIR